MIELGIVTLGGVFALYIFLPWVMKIVLRRGFLAMVENSRCTCLTFDDGPNPDSTPEILELLKKARAKATFFVLGENVEKYPSLTAKIVESGHELAEHSYQHIHPWKTEPFRCALDIVRGGRVIQRYRFSKESISFRPPYGKFNLVILIYILLARRRVAFWNVDPKDYDCTSASEVVQFVVSRLRAGSVVLLHDGRKNARSRVTVTVSALKSILKASRDRELCLTTVQEAFSKRTNG